MQEKPRFIIKTPSINEQTVIKAKYSDLSNKEKLQVFVELACYAKLEDEDVYYMDASNISNIRKASRWFDDELTFLGGRDANDLRDFWNLAIEDGGSTRTLFAFVKGLQEKYP